MNPNETTAPDKLETVARIVQECTKGTYLAGDTPADTLLSLLSDLADYFDDMRYLRAGDVKLLCEIARPYLKEHTDATQRDEAFKLISDLTANIVALCDCADLFLTCTEITHRWQDFADAAYKAGGPRE